jgi:hypothetical protein
MIKRAWRSSRDPSGCRSEVPEVPRAVIRPIRNHRALEGLKDYSWLSGIYFLMDAG